MTWVPPSAEVTAEEILVVCDEMDVPRSPALRTLVGAIAEEITEMAKAAVRAVD